MQRLKALELDLEIEGVTQTLRNLAVKQTAVWNKADIKRNSLEAIKSKLKRTEGLIFKSKTVGEDLRVKRLF